MGGRYEARRRRVLVIEDNLDAAESLRMMLELCGYRAEIAVSGPDGIDMAHSFLPDVILCDLGLPGMDGLSVARSLREDPTLKGVRLVALTGYVGPEDVARALSAGFDSHISKPADPEALLRLISLRS